MTTIPWPAADLVQIAPLHRFSTADYLEIIEKGVLGPDDHVELIGGMIVETSPQGTRHKDFLMNLNRLFVPLWDRAIVAIQATVTVAEGAVFDPDFLLLRKVHAEFKTRHPDAQDILLVVEAAESSLARDQKIKRPIYASAGVQDYWIADLEQEVLIVNRQPVAGHYQSIERLSGDDVVSPLATPDFTFAVRQAFE